MSLSFYPNQGMFLICDFRTGFVPPEMVKKRPVVVVSPRFRKGTNLCTVVPLSRTPPKIVKAYHHELDPTSHPDYCRGLTLPPVWAKCDMVTTVSIDRLDRYRLKALHTNRQYVAHTIENADLQAIQAGILNALGLQK